MKKVTILCLTVLCAAIVLASCSKPTETKGQPSDQVDAKAITLSAAQIDEVNAAFLELLPVDETEPPTMTNAEGAFVLNPITHFFTSYYEKAEDLDMNRFVYYMQRESFLSADDAAEIETLKASGMSLPFEDIENSSVPFGRIPAAAVDACLKTYANISLSAVSSMGDALYSEEYKTFYSYASDFDPGRFFCTSGEIKGDIVTLYSEDAVLTLQKEAENYYIVSHLAKT